MSNRPSIFEDDQDQGVDLTGFKPRQGRDPNAPPIDQLRQVSDLTGFPSRTPTAAAPQSQPRERYKSQIKRTGRNTQFFCRITKEGRDAFYGLAEAHNWTIGETVERALAALQREIERGS